jgi:DNA-binding transcriptional ArsR family regulator
MEDGRIRTQFDDLIGELKKAAGRPISVAELSSSTGLSQANVMKWLALLEKNGQVHIENRMVGVYASWIGEPEKSSPKAPEAVDAITQRPYKPEKTDIEIAKEKEEQAKGKLWAGKEEKVEEGQDGAKESEELLEKRLEHQKAIQSATEDLAEIEERIGRIGMLISELKKKKGDMTIITQDTPPAQSAPLDDLAEAERIMSEGQAQEEKIDAGVLEKEAEDAAKNVEEEEILQETKEAVPEMEMKEKAHLPQEAKQPALQAGKDAKSKMVQEKQAKPKTKKIAKPAPVAPTSVSLQFSERMARHVRKITAQLQEIEKLRMEKEKLLAEHYLPMQRRLEVEIETISDRVLRMEKNILSMQARASELPNKVQGVEKLQISAIKAHAEMKKAYDEASALLDEAMQQLLQEREKMSAILEQSRQELAEHKARAEELEAAIGKISQMEEEIEQMVKEARQAIAVQAEKLAAAEKSARELASIKSEIGQEVEEAKREMEHAKGSLASLEKQIRQMRQVEIWAGSLRQDYEKKMLEIEDYIRKGNEEFETLREAVEANFVRRYLKELRKLTDSYAFEMNQVKNIEASIDQRISEEKKKLEDLLEEGRKIAYLYETQAHEIEGEDKFRARAEGFRSISEIAASRTKLEQMIAQIVGNRVESQIRLAEPGKKEEGKKGKQKERKKRAK